LKRLNFSLPLNNEVGSVRCSDGRWGPMAQGAHDEVVVPISCTPGHYPDTVWHTHPHGEPKPSSADIENARSAGIKRVCVTVPQTGESSCVNVL